MVPVAVNGSDSPMVAEAGLGERVSVASSGGAIVTAALALPPFRVAVRGTGVFAGCTEGGVKL